MAAVNLAASITSRVCLLLLFQCTRQVYSQGADLVLLREAANKKGAVCLDGSPGGYYYRRGIGEGADKWIFYVEGGGWCYDEVECVERSKTRLGSSKTWPKTASYGGLLSANKEINPDFYDWNVAFLNYCDGASFAGNVTSTIVHNGTTLYFRGLRMLVAILGDVLEKGMKGASEVIITGCSAGGLATFIHVDYIRSQLPGTVYVRGLVDAGFFLDVKNWTGQYHIRPLYQYVYNMQNCSGGVNSDCIAANPGQEWMCFFAQYTFPHVKTPLFLLNSLYDFWQLEYILQLSLNCIDSPLLCPSDQQKQAFYSYRNRFLNASKAVYQSPTSGLFLPSCVDHCLALYDNTWSSVKIKGTVMSAAFYSWYKGNNLVRLVDCAYPCNETCRIKKS